MRKNKIKIVAVAMASMTPVFTTPAKDDGIAKMKTPLPGSER